MTGISCNFKAGDLVVMKSPYESKLKCTMEPVRVLKVYNGTLLQFAQSDGGYPWRASDFEFAKEAGQ